MTALEQEFDTGAILHAKALDQLSHLMTSYEAGVIGVEAFKIGVETIWACLGGVVKSDAFDELMTEANAYVRALPKEVKTTVVDTDAGYMVVAQRDGENVAIFTGQTKSVRHHTDALEDEAVSRVRNLIRKARDKGWKVSGHLHAS